MSFSCLLSHEPSIFSCFLQQSPVCSAPQGPRAFCGYVPGVHLSHLQSPSPTTHSCLQGTFGFRFHVIQILSLSCQNPGLQSCFAQKPGMAGERGVGEGTPGKSQGSHLVTDSPTDLCSVPHILSQAPQELSARVSPGRAVHLAAS